MAAWKRLLFCICAILTGTGGCEQAHTYPNDPIFASRQPTNSTPQSRPSSIIAYADSASPATAVPGASANASASSEGLTLATVRGQAAE
jgi:hypothetical protein